VEIAIHNVMAKKAKPEPEGYLIGYARVSTQDQNLDLQLDALRKAGVKEDNLHVEKLSASAKNRPALDDAIRDLREGDTLLVWRLDRFARSMRDLYARLDRVYAKGAKFRSLTEHFDFDTFTGKFVLGILGLVAELERQIIAHRTKAGIDTWKAKSGEDWGRQPELTEAQVVRAGQMLNRKDKPMSGPQVAKHFGVSAPTIYRHYQLSRSSRGPRFIRKTKPK
jgi:DNA invertase Pin-like site-specific DNA recombinase